MDINLFKKCPAFLCSFLLVLFTFLSQQRLYSQAQTCGSATILCSVEELNGYSFTMSGNLHPGDAPTPLCGGQGWPHNPNWFAFTAWCESMTLEVTSSNCQPPLAGGSTLGIQSAIYSNCSYTEVACDTAGGSCNDNGTRVLNLSGLVVGAVYYMVVDGCLGSYCDVTISVNGGCSESISDWINGVQGEECVCVGDTEVYTVDDLIGEDLFHWYIDGTSIGTTVDFNNSITWSTAGVFELCVDASHEPCVPESDFPDQTCMTVTVIGTEAGTITVDPNPLCPNETANLTASGYNADTDYCEAILVTDLSGSILQVDIGDTGTFSHDMCANFLVYSYNFYCGKGETYPSVGDNVNGINCGFTCCDLESETLIFEDTEIPTFVLPTVGTYSCYDDFLNQVTEVPDIEWNDNCDGTDMVEGVESGTVDQCNGGTITWTWEYTDNCGNYGTDFIDIVIPALVVPDWIAPLPEATIEVVCGDPIPAALDMYLENGEAAPCDLSDGPIAPVVTGDDPLTDCGDVITRTWEYTDECGNILTTLTQTVTLTDDVLPVFDSSPSAIADIMCGDPLPDQEDLTGTDNCNTPTVTESVDSYTEDDCNGYTITYRWTIEDECNNSDEVTMSFNVLPDDEDPTFDGPPTALGDIECFEDRHSAESLTASDVCGNVMVDSEETFTEDICAGYMVTIEWTATDDCGNTATEQLQYQVLPDTEPPTISPPADETVDCAAIPPVGTPTAEDACTDNASITINYLGETEINDGTCPYILERRWEAVDICGNVSDVAVQTITVDDQEAPTFLNVPPTLRFFCSSEIDDMEDLDWEDNCSPGGTVSGTQDIDPSTVGCPGETITRTWEATDECGNVGTATQLIIIEPINPIVWISSLPGDEILDCGDPIPAAVSLSYSNAPTDGDCLFDGAEDPEETGSLVNCGDEIIREWMVTDDCGNTLSHTQTITLQDLELPEFTDPPSDLTFLCGLVLPDMMDLAWTDNCGASDVSVGVQVGDPTTMLCDGGTITRTWEATDDCDNMNTHVQTITIEPLPDVVWTTPLPPDEVIFCGDDEPSPIDLDYSNGATDPECLEEGTESPDPPVGELVNCGDTKTYTYTYETMCGDVLTHDWVITLQDISPPEWVMTPPASITIDCLDDLPPVQQLEWLDNCDGMGFVDFTEIGTLDLCMGGSIIREWRKTDDCGNGPIIFTQSIILPFPDRVACDDGDPCTFDDMGDLNCEGNFCNCEGTQKPDIDISGSLSFCLGGTTTLEAFPGVSYIWSTGETTQQITVGIADVYNVTVTDTDGCQRNTGVTVIQDTELNPIILGDLDICIDEVTSLDAGAGFAVYEWDNGSGDQILFNLTEGEYTVTVTDFSGCQGSSTVQIITHPVLNFEITGIDEICTGGLVELTATPGFEDYYWSNGLQGESITVNVGGPYSVIAYDFNRCQYIGEHFIVEKEIELPTILGDHFFCDGGEVTLTSSIEYDEYLWSNGDTGISTTVDESGTINLIVSDNSGCTASTTVFVEEFVNPNPTILGSSSICVGSTATLSTQEFESYLWSTSETIQEITVSDPGEYYLEVTDVNGCIGYDTLELILSTSLSPVISGDTLICPGSTTTLDAGGYFSYQWDDVNNSTTRELEVSAAGQYSVTVSDQGGCTGISSVMVIESELMIEISGDPFYCEGSFTSLEVPDTFDKYSWSNGFNTNSIVINEEGTFSITVTDNKGCTASSEVMVGVVPAPSVTINGLDAFCPGESVLIESDMAFSSYLWNTDDTTQSLEVDSVGVYTITVTDMNGCTASSSINVTENGAANLTIGGSLSYCLGSFTLLDGGAEFVSWEWSTGESTQTIEVDEESTIQLIVTDVNGCTTSAEVEVTEELNLTPVITGDRSICRGEMGTLNGGSNFGSWMWSTGETTETIEITEGGTYGITVTDISGGCSGEGEVEVVVFDQPTPIIDGDNMICPGESTTLSVTEMYASYLWSNGETSPTIDVDMGQDYSVVVTDARGCEGSSDFQLMVNSLPQVNVQNLNCAADFASYSVAFSTDADLISNDLGLDVNDLGNQEFEIVGIDTSMSISLMISNSLTNCDTTLLIDAPNCNCIVIADAGADSQLDCNQSSITLGGSDTSTGGNYEYTWTNESGDVLGNDLTIVTTVAGVYTLTVRDVDRDCNISDEVEILFFADPDPLINGQFEFCQDGMVSIEVDDIYSRYEWSNGDTGPMITVDATGDYIVTVTDSNGCTASSLQAVVENALPTVDLEIVCDDSKETYMVIVKTDGDVVIADVGNVTQDGDCFLISDVDTMFDVNVQIINSLTTCENFGFVDRPDCSCTAKADAGSNQQIDCNNSEAILGTSDITVGSDYTITWLNEAGDVISNDAIITVDYGGTFTLVVYDIPNDCEVVDMVEVAIFDDPMPTIMGDSEFCEEENSVLELNEVFSSYDWSTNESTPSITVDQGGTYMVTVSDANGCTASTEMVVVEHSLPTYSIDVVCSTDKMTYDVIIKTDADQVTSDISNVSISGDCFEIVQVDTSIKVIVLEFIHSGTNCAITVPVQAPDCDCNAIADAGDAQIIDCDNLMVSLGGANASTGTDFEINWYNEAGQLVGSGPNVSVGTAGIYTQVVYDRINDCEWTDEVLVQDITNSPIAIISADPDNIVDCLIESISLTADTVPNAMYSWYSQDFIADGVQSIVVENGGVFNLVVLDTITGCIATDSILVVDQEEYPIVVIDDPEVIDCSNNEITISAVNSQTGPDIEHTWLDENQDLIVNANGLSLTVTEPGVYYFMSIDPTNGCENIDSVTVNSIISFPEIEAGEDELLSCNGEPVMLNVSVVNAGANYLVSWEDSSGAFNDGNETIEVTTPGWYFVQVINEENGCSGIDSVFVDINDDFPELNQLVSGPPSCFGESDAFIAVDLISGGQAPYSYYINGNEVSIEDLNSLSSGNYNVEIIDALGCESDTTISIIEPEIADVNFEEISIIVDLGDSTQLFVITNIPEADIDTIIWNPTDFLSCTNCLDPFAFPLQSTSYEVTVIDKDGCEDDAFIRLDVNKKADVYVGNGFTPNEDNNNDKIFVQSDNNIEVVLGFEIYDRWGNMVFADYDFPPNDPAHGWDGTYKGVLLNPAVFVYKISYVSLAGDSKVVAGDVTLIR